MKLYGIGTIYDMRNSIKLIMNDMNNAVITFFEYDGNELNV